jgi:RHS repeat-associated protein
MLSAQHGSWPDTFSYDGADRLIQTFQNGETIGYVYNIPGRTRQITYPGGRVIAEHTDFRWRMDHINDAAYPQSIVQYTYDLANNALSRDYRNGTTSAFTYNANNWTTNIAHNNPATFAQFGYAYDNEGNKQYENKSPQDSAHSEGYQYDSTYRLINYQVGTLVASTITLPVTQTSYSLDPVGNWNSKTTNGVPQTRQYNADNELIEINAQSLTYDNNGNTLNDGTYTYAHDEENRLTSVTRNSDSVVVGQYQYDALFRRVQKIADPGGAPSTTVYFYDDTRIVEEQNSLGVTSATYVYGNYVDEVLTMDLGGSTYYYHQNALWSVEAITDNTGTPVERYSYCSDPTQPSCDGYGFVVVTDGSGNPVPLNAWGTPHSAIGNPWMFTGRQIDEETGLYFYRTRYYDPAKGRFLERDLLGYVDGANLYEYVKDNPLLQLDPTGADAARPYENVPQQELVRMLDNLPRARIEWRAAATTPGTPEWKRAQMDLEQLEQVQQELNLRQWLKQPAPKACAASGKDPCAYLKKWLEFTALLDTVGTITDLVGVMGDIASLGGTVITRKVGEKIVREVSIKALKKVVEDKLKSMAKDIVVGDVVKDLLGDVLNPQAACLAYAKCQVLKNGRTKPETLEFGLVPGRVNNRCSYSFSGNQVTVQWQKVGWNNVLAEWFGR